MKKNDVDDYLQEGIYGSREINPSERKLFLGTFRERVVLALTKAQVMQGQGKTEVEQLMRENPKSRLLLNGNVSIRFFKPYKKLASKHNIRYTSVKNRDAKSDYGIVLTLDYAVDKEDIFIVEKNKKEDIKKKKPSLISRLFGKSD
ncbi:YueI family protein [Aquibacillus saliphilus]|uniref:YueI family protein n=1 Tax=Aquibacillus saliphilus TaxID=1909422 RepID=UPI001CF064CF|nr:YueI family protein [Aquibacillus saliphilus]